MPDQDPDLRTPVPTGLEPGIRRVRRLYLARIDLEEAQSAIAEIQKSGIRLSRTKEPQPLLVALTNAMLISYARPWVHSRALDMAEPYLPGYLLKSLTKRQRAVHNYLIDTRNVAIAHTDADAADLHLMFTPSGTAAIFRYTREPFTRAQLREIGTIIRKVLAAIDNESNMLERQFPQGAWY